MTLDREKQFFGRNNFTCFSVDVFKVICAFVPSQEAQIIFTKLANCPDKQRENKEHSNGVSYQGRFSEEAGTLDENLKDREDKGSEGEEQGTSIGRQHV